MCRFESEEEEKGREEGKRVSHWREGERRRRSTGERRGGRTRRRGGKVRGNEVPDLWDEHQDTHTILQRLHRTNEKEEGEEEKREREERSEKEERSSESTLFVERASR